MVLVDGLSISGSEVYESQKVHPSELEVLLNVR